jgi:hypothetical protein
MDVPTSEVGYTSAITRRGDNEVHKGHVVREKLRLKIIPWKTLLRDKIYTCFPDDRVVDVEFYYRGRRCSGMLVSVFSC